MLGFFVNLLLGLLSYIIKKDKDLFIIGAGSGELFFDNSKYLYLYANPQEEKKFVWITKSKEVYDMLKSKGLPVINLKTPRGFWNILKANKLIFSSSVEDISYFKLLVGKFKFIQLWHGNALKKLPFACKENTLKSKVHGFLLRKEYSKIEFVLHTSQKTSWNLEDCFKTKRVKILGYPRNDSLFNPTSFEKKIQLDQYDNVFFYMPTFRDTKSELKPFTTQGLIKLNKTLVESNSIFLLKKHCAEKNWISLEGYSNILDISEINDAWEILPFTTVVITDYSSVVCDTSLIEKPMIFYHYDYKEYITKQREMAFDYFKDLPGPFVEREEDLISLIKNLDWTKSESYKEKVRQFKQETNLFLDNHSSERVYNEILKEFVA